jgi:hypothetical protein
LPANAREQRLRACPQCAGSLRQKHLKAGCLTSAPKQLLLWGALAWLAQDVLSRSADEPAPANAPASGAAALTSECGSYGDRVDRSR